MHCSIQPIAAAGRPRKSLDHVRLFERLELATPSPRVHSPRVATLGATAVRRERH